MQSEFDSTTRSLNVALTTEDITTLLDGGLIEDMSGSLHVSANLLPETGRDTPQIEPDAADNDEIHRQMGASTSRAVVLLGENTRRQTVAISVAESLLRNANFVQSEPLYSADITTLLTYTPVHTIRIKLPDSDSIAEV